MEENKDKNELETIIPKYEEVKIVNKVYKIGRLGFRQVANLGMFFDAVLPKIKDAIKPGVNSNEKDFQLLMSTINDDELCQLFSILSNEQDKDFIKENILTDGVLCTDIIALICQHNNFKKLFGNFQKATRI